MSDVISIPATGDLFRMLYDPRGIFYLHRIDEAESQVSVFYQMMLLVL